MPTASTTQPITTCGIGLNLLQFEDAMRTVPGCEEVTLPYWDFSKKLPNWINKKPFKSYKLQDAVHPAYPKDHPTKRHTPSQIATNFKNEGILATIEDALTKSGWEAFNDGVEGTHDSAHPACGPSLAHPDIASFDPLFWFFHANWDRLWWRWQQIMQATTLWTYRSTFTDPSTGLFFTAPLNKMRPNFMTGRQNHRSQRAGGDLYPADGACSIDRRRKLWEPGRGTGVHRGIRIHNVGACARHR